MGGLTPLLLVIGAGLVVVLVRALFAGNIHSQYAVTYRDQNPGTFWAMWIVLLLPLVAVLFLVANVHPRAHP
jgi:hypothetical protein